MLNKVKTWKYSNQTINYFERLNLDETIFTAMKKPSITERTDLPQIFTKFSYSTFNNFARLDEHPPEAYSRKNDMTIKMVDSKTSFYKRENDKSNITESLYDMNQLNL